MTHRDDGNSRTSSAHLSWDHRDGAIDSSSNKGAPHDQVLLPDRGGGSVVSRRDGDHEPSRDDRRLMRDARGKGEGRGAIRALLITPRMDVSRLDRSPGSPSCCESPGSFRQFARKPKPRRRVV